MPREYQHLTENVFRPKMTLTVTEVYKTMLDISHIIYSSCMEVFSVPGQTRVSVSALQKPAPLGLS